MAKTIVGREELDKFGDVNVSDVLKRLPGVNMQGGNPRLRGLGAGYTLVLINGEAPPPGFSLDNLSPSQVERIEVTKGPTAEHSTQAVAGTINIILRTATRQRQRELRLGLNYQVRRAVPNFNANFSESLGDLSMTLPLSAYQWSGGAEPTSDRNLPDALGQPQRVLTSGRNWWRGGGATFGPRLSWKVDAATTIESQSLAQRNEFRSGGVSTAESVLGAAPSSVREDYLTRGHWQMGRSSLQLVRRDSDGSRLEAKVGLQESHSEYRADGLAHPPAAAPFLRLNEGATDETSRTTTGKYTRPLAEAHTLAAGWDVEHKQRREVRSTFENGVSQLLGFDGEPFNAKIVRQALWLQDEWALSPQWGTYLGLRAERIGTTSRGSADTLASTSTVVTPLWHLNYKFDRRDLIRASLTRSYRAPELNALMARPSINNNYPLSGPNAAIAPDRVGNPALQPELSTGLDIAFEKYFANGGVMSIGIFGRRISGLVRNLTSLEAVPWAAVPRWVQRPVNLERASSLGLELELKGRAAELLPSAWGAPAGLSLRGSLAVYRSRVDDIPGPDNRLDGQQPWSMTTGFDHAVTGMPLTWGASLAYTPGYAVQQTVQQLFEGSRSRVLDAYLLWTFSREATLRLSAGNIAPLDTTTRTAVDYAEELPQLINDRRNNRTSFNASLTLKF